MNPREQVDLHRTTAPVRRREQVDLRRSLPVWAQYGIALGVVLLVFVAIIVYWQAGNQANPVWQDVITRAFVPVAGWIGIAAFAFVLLRRLRRRR